MNLNILLAFFLCKTANGILQTYILFTRNNSNDPIYLEKEDLMNYNLSTRIIIPDYPGIALCSVCLKMKDSYLRKEDYNVVIYDWSKNVGAYDEMVANSKILGRELGHLLYSVIKRFDIIHIIGIGLGAHIGGFAGKQIKDYEEGLIGRISGIDPTYPLFNGSGSEERLSSSDAEMVDVYHCDGDNLGFGVPIGTVDFFLNGGVAPQPGCNDGKNMTLLDYMYKGIDYMYKGIDYSACSHVICTRYFAEAIDRNDIMARKCDSWSDYVNGSCKETIIFGENVHWNAKGNFFLKLTSLNSQD